MNTHRVAALSTLARYHATRRQNAPTDAGWKHSFREKLFATLASREEAEAQLLFRTLDGLDRDPLCALFTGSLLGSKPQALAEALPAHQSAMDAAKLPPSGGVTDLGRGHVHLRVFGEVAFSLPEVLPQVQKADTVTVQINSNGGNAFDALKLATELKAKQTEVLISGTAASAAAILAQCGAVRRITADSRVMVHPLVAYTCGSAGELRQQADALDASTAACVALFHRSPPDLVKRWFTGGDHWFTAGEAKAAGLVDEVLPAPDTTGDLAEAVTKELLTRLKAAFPDPARFQQILKAL